MTSREVFASLDGREFETYLELQQAVVYLFNRHLSDFLSGYTYRHELDAALRHGWIVRGQNLHFHVRVGKPVTA